MKTKVRRRLLNGLMTVVICVIALCGVMAVGNIRGWIGGSDSSISSKKVSGVVNIERSGVGYSLKNATQLRNGDIIETKQGSEAELVIDEKNTVVMGENTELTIVSENIDEIQLKVERGEIFADVMKPETNIRVDFGKNTMQVTGSVLGVSVQAGSDMLYMYSGETEVSTSDDIRETIEEKEVLSVTENAYAQAEIQVTELEEQSLNEFFIRQALCCESKNDLCFTPKELEAVLEGRAAEKKKALEESVNSETHIQTAQEEEHESDNKDPETSGEKNILESEEIVNSQTEEQDKSETKTSQCTIEIRCDTILNNMDNLSDGKEAYVPENGCILSTSTVDFSEGETVFDILERVCSYAGIQLEYSWSPVFDSYYIEGMNHLYEFDCGNESGWMYKVNGWYPNYGCSAYTLNDGDVIVWTYTCNGLGADVGARTS